MEFIAKASGKSEGTPSDKSGESPVIIPMAPAAPSTCECTEGEYPCACENDAKIPKPPVAKMTEAFS